jgi:hypothetical protein
MRALALLAAALVLTLAGPADAKGRRHRSHASATSVKSHVTRKGTLVKSHQKTTPNGTRNDNWGTRGNVNPVTGKAGTAPRDGQAR